jgi:hypothetical protein
MASLRLPSASACSPNGRATGAIRSARPAIARRTRDDQVNAVYMFTLSVIGKGLGPTAMALLTDNLFHAESGLRYSMVTAAAISTPLVLLGMWRAMKPYGELHLQITEAEAAG